MKRACSAWSKCLQESEMARVSFDLFLKLGMHVVVGTCTTAKCPPCKDNRGFTGI